VTTTHPQDLAGSWTCTGASWMRPCPRCYLRPASSLGCWQMVEPTRWLRSQ